MEPISTFSSTSHTNSKWGRSSAWLSDFSATLISSLSWAYDLLAKNAIILRNVSVIRVSQQGDECKTHIVNQVYDDQDNCKTWDSEKEQGTEAEC